MDQADLDFHHREYERLRAELQQAFEQSRLPEVPSGAAALNDLLIRLRIRLSRSSLEHIHCRPNSGSSGQ